MAYMRNCCARPSNPEIFLMTNPSNREINERTIHLPLKAYKFINYLYILAAICIVYPVIYIQYSFMSMLSILISQLQIAYRKDNLLHVMLPELNHVPRYKPDQSGSQKIIFPAVNQLIYLLQL